MSLNIFWFLPTHGDGHYLGSSEGARSVDHGYLQQIAQAADRLGFGGVLIPTGRSCEDSWLVAASLIPVTQRLKFLVALRPGIISPTLAARQAATLDRLSNGRALFNLVTGGDPDELAAEGLHLNHDSGDPFEWGEKAIAHYQTLGIDPMSKTLVFSDNLDLEKALALYRRFDRRINLVFGIGTRLTCDIPGVKPLNIVIKLVECKGKPVAKLSDSPGKTICQDQAFVKALRKAFDLPLVKKAS